MPFWGATGTPVLISGDVSYGFQSQWVLPYSLFCEGKRNVHNPRSTSGATHADLLSASITDGHFPTCMSRGGTWLRFG